MRGAEVGSLVICRCCQPRVSDTPSPPPASQLDAANSHLLVDKYGKVRKFIPIEGHYPTVVFIPGGHNASACRSAARVGF